MFKNLHPRAKPPETLRLRLELLRLTVLSRGRTHRISDLEKRPRAATKTRKAPSPSLWSSAALATLRHKNRRRAVHWWQRHERDTSDSLDDTGRRGAQARDTDAQNMVDVLSKPWDTAGEGFIEHGETQDSAGGIALLDLLPLFVAVTARRARIAGDDWMTTETWLGLMADFMLHAVVEQSKRMAQVRLEHEAENGFSYPSTDTTHYVREAFAWGPLPKHDHTDTDAMAIDGTVDARDPQPGDEDDNDIFLSKPPSDRSSVSESPPPSVSPPREAAAEPWYRLRAATLAKLTLSPSGLRDQFNTQNRAAFELEFRSFLTGLAASISKPLLTQLEEASAAEEAGKVPTVLVEGGVLDMGDTRRLLRAWRLGL